MVLYDLPRFSILNLRTNDSQCVSRIDEVDFLTIRPTRTRCQFEYSIQTAMIVLEDDDVFYLRKTPAGFSYFNKASGQFELLNDFVAAQTGLAAKWIISIFQTDTPVVALKELTKTLIDRTKLEPAVETEVWSIATVQGPLPTFTRSFDVGPVVMQQTDIDLLLNNDGDLNDLVTNGHLFISSTTTHTDCKDSQCKAIMSLKSSIIG